jgi:CheY-like chemotaxis protein
MTNSNLLCLYHPTTVLLIDDDERFLRSISLQIDYNTPFKIFQDASKALKHIEKAETHDKFLSRIIEFNEEDELMDGVCPVNFKICDIYREAFNPNIFDIISVVIVDLDMPGINGLKVLETLRDKRCKKILLTGHSDADGDYAVKLFNSKMINKFIQKGTPFIEKILNESIKDLQLQYFQDLTKILLMGFPKSVTEMFADPKIGEFFNNTVRNNLASSFFLIDTLGSFILLDSDAEYHFVLLRTEEDLAEFGKQADVEGAPKSISEAIKNGEKIAFFNSFDEYCDAVETGSWEKYLYDSNKISGDKDYRYSIVDKIKGFQFNKEDIACFSEFMKKLNE